MTLKHFFVLIPLLSLGLAAMGADTAAPGKDKKASKAKAYPLKICLVTDETLDADPSMKSYAFVHQGQEIKLCCKACLKDFKKETNKHLKKLEAKAKEAEKNKPGA